MSTNITVAEIKEAFPDEKNDALWTRFVLRPLSYVFAWLFIRLRVSANQVTYLSILFVIAGSILFGTGSYQLAILGAVFFNIFSLLDCVDGNIARVHGGNPFGEWVDALGGYTAYTFLFLSVGVYAEASYGEFWMLGPVDFVLLGAIGAVANLLMRVQHQKFKNIRDGGESDDSESGDSGGGDSLQKKVSRNVGITGFLMPAVLVGVVIGLVDWVLVFYAGFYSAAWIALTVKNVYNVEAISN